MRRRLLAVIGGLALAACAGDGAKQGPATGGAGDAYAGALRVRPEAATFAETRVGCVRSVTLELENGAADATIAVTGAELPHASLTLAAALPLSLAPGRREFVDLHFAPTAPGSFAGSVALETDEGGPPYRLAATGSALAAPERSLDSTGLEPLDLVFVLDVSTTMNETASLRQAALDLFDAAASRGLDVRFGLTTFVNDVVVHRDGAFLDREGFLAELDSQLVPETRVPDPALPRQLLNFDFPENGLGALYRSAAEFDFRPGARRYLLFVTDGSFLEPPAVFSNGSPALHSYAEVARILADREVRLFSVHSRDHGRGLSTNYDGGPSLVTLTGGTWFEISDVDSGRLALGDLLTNLLVGPACG
jgi:hypothetical protein